MAGQVLVAQGHIRNGDEVIVISGRAGFKGTTNQLKIHVVGDDQ